MNLEYRVKQVLEKVNVPLEWYEPIEELIMASGIAKNYGHGWEDIEPEENWLKLLENYFREHC